MFLFRVFRLYLYFSLISKKGKSNTIRSIRHDSRLHTRCHAYRTVEKPMRHANHHLLKATTKVGLKLQSVTILYCWLLLQYRQAKQSRLTFEVRRGESTTQHRLLQISQRGGFFRRMASFLRVCVDRIHQQSSKRFEFLKHFDDGSSREHAACPTFRGVTPPFSESFFQRGESIGSLISRNTDRPRGRILYSSGTSNISSFLSPVAMVVQSCHHGASCKTRRRRNWMLYCYNQKWRYYWQIQQQIWFRYQRFESYRVGSSHNWDLHFI